MPQTMEQRRAGLDLSQARHRDELLKMFPVMVKDSTVAGVPVRDVVPTTIKHKDREVICLHGGGFDADSGSYSESIPVAGLTGVRVVSVSYRLAPEHPFPAGVEDVIAVYKELLKTIGFQVLPPSAMWRMVPFVPTVQPNWGSEKVTDSRS